MNKSHLPDVKFAAFLSFAAILLGCVQALGQSTEQAGLEKFVNDFHNQWKVRGLAELQPEFLDSHFVSRAIRSNGLWNIWIPDEILTQFGASGDDDLKWTTLASILDANFIGTSLIIANPPDKSGTTAKDMADFLVQSVDGVERSGVRPLWTAACLRGFAEDELIDVNDAPIESLSTFNESLLKARQQLYTLAKREEPWESTEFKAYRDRQRYNFQRHPVSPASPWVLELLETTEPVTGSDETTGLTDRFATAADGAREVSFRSLESAMPSHKVANASTVVTEGRSQTGAAVDSVDLFQVSFDQYIFVVSSAKKIYAILPFVE